MFIFRLSKFDLHYDEYRNIYMSEASLQTEQTTHIANIAQSLHWYYRLNQVFTDSHIVFQCIYTSGVSSCYDVTMQCHFPQNSVFYS